jgi:hypothetical protein
VLGTLLPFATNSLYINVQHRHKSVRSSHPYYNAMERAVELGQAPTLFLPMCPFGNLISLCAKWEELLHLQIQVH